jgi:hypothetical protein
MIASVADVASELQDEPTSPGLIGKSVVLHCHGASLLPYAGPIREPGLPAGSASSSGALRAVALGNGRPRLKPADILAQCIRDSARRPEPEFTAADALAPEQSVFLLGQNCQQPIGHPIRKMRKEGIPSTRTYPPSPRYRSVVSRKRQKSDVLSAPARMLDRRALMSAACAAGESPRGVGSGLASMYPAFDGSVLLQAFMDLSALAISLAERLRCAESATSWSDPLTRQNR